MVCLLIVACSGPPSTPEPRPKPERPNLLLISIDSLRSDHLGLYGYSRNTSPVIDRLGREGVFFSQALAPSSWTLPSHATLFTGQPPRQHGVDAHNRGLSPEAVTLAEVLKAAGYRTAAFVSGPFLGGVYGFTRGFDVYDESTIGDEQTVHRAATSPRLEKLASTWLEESLDQHPQSPFFVFLHMWDPHHDYARRESEDPAFDPDYEGDLSGEDIIKDPRFNADMPARDLEHVIALYDEEIRYTDRHIGSIVELLRRRGVLDDTIVVVTSDHGEEFFEHGQRTHSNNLHDEVLRIPLVIRYPPRIAAGLEVERQVRLMDVAPTVLGLAGVSGRESLGTGSNSQHRERDLTPWITGAETPDSFPELLSFAHMTNNGLQGSVRSEKLKVIFRYKRGPVTTEVYDLEADPGEQSQLPSAQRRSREVRKMIAEALAWDRRWRNRPAPSQDLKVDEDQMQRLRVLGYVE